MNKLFVAFIFPLLFSTTASRADNKTPAAGGYEIKIRIKSLKDTSAVLANYFGDKTYKADTGHFDKNGWVVFKGAHPLPCGVYMLACGTAKMFEFIVKDQFFSIETDTGDYLAKAKLKGSPENEIFFKFQQHSSSYGYKIYHLRNDVAELEKDSTKAKLATKLRDSASKLEKEERAYTKKILDQYPESVLNKILKITEDIVVPPSPKDANGKVIDSMFQSRYFLDHYWDLVDFKSECIIRSPVYHNKLKTYFDKVVVPIPDTVIVYADRLIEQTRGNYDLFKYTVHYLTNLYGNAQYICQDAIAVHLILKYYTFKDCNWVDSAEIVRMRARAETALPTLCGKIAPDVAMHDSILERHIIHVVKTETNNTVERSNKIFGLMQKYGTANLHSVKADYTVIVFWDPDCSHCKAEMPKLKAFYEKYKSQGVEIYAACVEQDYDKWIKYIYDNQLKWVNVIDIYNISEFRKYYDISATPVIILVDKNKKIIAKKINAEALEPLIEHDKREKEGKN
jgi:thiol-disulfide isomerase/thioredoxin